MNDSRGNAPRYAVLLIASAALVGGLGCGTYNYKKADDTTIEKSKPRPEKPAPVVPPDRA